MDTNNPFFEVDTAHVDAEVAQSAQNRKNIEEQNARKAAYLDEQNRVVPDPRQVIKVSAHVDNCVIVRFFGDDLPCLVPKSVTCPSWLAVLRDCEVIPEWTESDQAALDNQRAQQATKETCRATILARYSETDQANMSARLTVLTALGKGQSDEAKGIIEGFQWIEDHVASYRKAKVVGL